MKIVIPSDRFREMDKMIGKIKYAHAKKLVDFLNSFIVVEEEKKIKKVSTVKENVQT